MIQINPFKTNLNKDNDVCLICHCNLEDEQIYELPECSHKYHTDCIIQWFLHTRLYIRWYNTMVYTYKDVLTMV